jgi:hypothetical protein
LTELRSDRLTATLMENEPELHFRQEMLHGDL